MPIPDFGGTWSLIKLSAVGQYLGCYTVALRRQSFSLIYIDAFAGAGKFAFGRSAAPLLNETADVQEHVGSAVRAARIQPPFEHLYFIELSARKLRALQRQLVQWIGRCTFLHGDANVEVQRLCRELSWANRRGVIFLDPFGMKVKWPTLQAIAATKALDVWYLFPISGLARQAAIDSDAITPEARRSLTENLGTMDWETAFYEEPPEDGPNLFGLPPVARAPQRTLNINGIEAFVRKQLSSIFPHVVPNPLRLGPRGTPLYSLFFAVSNPSPKAKELADRLARAIIQQHG